MMMMLLLPCLPSPEVVVRGNRSLLPRVGPGRRAYVSTSAIVVELALLLTGRRGCPRGLIASRLGLVALRGLRGVDYAVVLPTDEAVDLVESFVNTEFAVLKDIGGPFGDPGYESVDAQKEYVVHHYQDDSDG